MQLKKMAAPCQRMAGRSFLQLWSRFSRTPAGNVGHRRFSVAVARRATIRPRAVADRAASPWTVAAAACLQRLPVISAEFSPTETRFKNMLQQLELEKSLLSDHELRLMEDAELIRRKQANEDSDDEDSRGNQEIILGQDLEDAWEQKLIRFQPAPRFRAKEDEDATSAERCLADTLVLLNQQQLGSEKVWLLPQAQWQQGETLRQTAERALASLPAAGFKATFLGNAPCGVYKYKLPKAVRTESSVGVKLFFFKAVLADAAPPKTPNAPLVWVKKSELEQYLKPAYMMAIDRFILSL